MNKEQLIAVVAMDGIFPGALNLDRFWHNIVNGIDQSAPVPENRWIAPPRDRLGRSCVPDRSYSRHACLIDGFTFDSQAFSLDPELSRHLDVMHQLALTAAKRAFNGCVTAPIDPRRIDTILAAIALPSDSASAFSRQTLGQAIEKRLFAHAAPPAAVTLTQALASRVDGLPAALLAAAMGCGGDCFTLDAACASSIYAVKLACDALASKRADLVLTGGVSRPECLYTQIGFSQLQALSPSGRCAPFDRRADGLVVGEGVGILALKRLADALAHGDTIHGVIHGIGLSNDLRGNLLAPESRGQVRAMAAAYRAAGWHPSEVDLIECHGTGTPTGDSTEIESLSQLWTGVTAVGDGCAIGSVKSSIGHLLTAAGAAGMIKALLALQHRILPPSINFEQAPPNGPLANSPFRVQTAPAPWDDPPTGRPRRAAVSAFGFGGINAHILLEAWPPTAASHRPIHASRRPIPLQPLSEPLAPVAIVGMDVTLGPVQDLKSFEKAILAGHSAITDRPPQRWKGLDSIFMPVLKGFDPKGAYIDSLPVGIGEFQIPPNEISAILPQQLLALKVGAGALADAGLPQRAVRERMGVVFGIGFDFEATNFHLRWQLFSAVRRWNAAYGLNLDEQALDAWLEQLRDQVGPPLTPARVMGALGGIVASRMAREFRFGGPSFVVSADAASGIKALRAAVDLLRQKAVDAMLVGAVDLCGDLRSVLRMDRLLPLSRTNTVRPFDASADGTLPGDGAAALVVKTLAQAQADGDRIYAVIRGIGVAGGDDPQLGRVKPSTYRRSLSQSFSGIDALAGLVSYVEAHATGEPERDRIEITALADFFSEPGRSDPANAIALGSTKPVSGYTGAADGLLAVVKTALCLNRRTLPPLMGFTQPADNLPALPFHMPDRAQPWYRDRERGPRTACCASITLDGACCHTVLQEHDHAAPRVAATVAAPPTADPPGLFVISADTPALLLQELAQLKARLAGDLGSVAVSAAAARWIHARAPRPDHRLALCLILQPAAQPAPIMDEARRAIESGQSDPRSRQVFHSSRPIGAAGRLALVYPGSGNHYLGMGRDLALFFPEIVALMDRQTSHLKTQWRPWHLMPWRTSWPPGWQTVALSALTADPLNMIFGQVVFGDLMTRILDRFHIRADAVIGYSLGESAALFAQGVWPDRGAMLSRMQATDLFTTQLAGPCTALRQAWRIPEQEPVRWRVAVVNRPAHQVRRALEQTPHARLLIVNSPSECVIGGLEPAVDQAIAAMACQAVPLDGVVTVHCDAAAPAAEAYHRLHRFPTAPRPDLQVYSCSWAGPYEPTAELCADSILKQAVDGFDFNKTINRAYADGITVFIEVGPRGSCSRMIDQILDQRPHVAVAANPGHTDEINALLQCLGRLAAERVPFDLRPLSAAMETPDRLPAVHAGPLVHVRVGGPPLNPALPAQETGATAADGAPFSATQAPASEEAPIGPNPLQRPQTPAPQDRFWVSLIETSRRTMQATAESHQRFLDLSQELTHTFSEAFDLQNRLLQPALHLPAADAPGQPPPAFDREMCLAFAVGSAARVLGPAFGVVDTHRVRVRLPDEPLMLVDRILCVDGQMLSMGSGRVVTEHDVQPGAWYLDGGRAPVCISVEAGQADLFLCAYLGIDHQVQGERAYRLLDAAITFHRGLPRPGETIRYDIRIDRFVRQGDTWMFFFHFDGTIAGQPLISMRDGCAGFFTEAEVLHSGGIILTQEECRPAAGRRPDNWQPPLPMARESYSDDQVAALRRGDLAGCFGPRFAGIELAPPLRLPGGRLRLIHRILELDPCGGRYGLGLIRAEADIHPDDWFLVCHFVDDPVMPGTLMYECCAHTLRVFLQRMGWVTDQPGVCYEPLIGSQARLKCRGPVTPATRQVHYEIQISALGFGPEPYAVADAHLFADGRRIVFFKDMSLKMTGTSREAIDTFWHRRQTPATTTNRPTPPAAPLYDRDAILSFAVGNPSEAFGEPYRIFDSQRTIARLPGPPYCFMDRVIHLEPRPWVLEPGGWVTAQYDIPETGWYFAADRSGAMPFCVLLEIALQPCGWLAAYAGSALCSQQDLKFRNLGGQATLHRQPGPEDGTLTMRCRLTRISRAADMIIENFDFQVLAGSEPVYSGDTDFGFFSAAALARQKGLGSADAMVTAMAAWSGRREAGDRLAMDQPDRPETAAGKPARVERLRLPAKALLMIEALEAYLPDGGAHGLGYLRGLKTVDPQEWFFKAHFFQDPVCPGSLGIESLVQLMKAAALKRWPHLAHSHRFRLLAGQRHRWSYRGQIIPTNRTVVVEAVITHLQETPAPTIRADGLLSVDGLPIYKMDHFELALVPAADRGRP